MSAGVRCDGELRFHEINLTRGFSLTLTWENIAHSRIRYDISDRFHYSQAERDYEKLLKIETITDIQPREYISGSRILFKMAELGMPFNVDNKLANIKNIKSIVVRKAREL